MSRIPPVGVTLYSGETLAEGAQIALTARLFVPGWQLSGVLGRMRASPGAKDRITITFVGGEPISVATYDERTDQIMCFTRKSMRGNGYGTLAVQMLRVSAKSAYADAGIYGSEQFWAALNIRVRRTSY